MHEVGFWRRPTQPGGAHHIVYILNGEHLTYCGAHKQLRPGAKYYHNLNEEMVDCGSCKKKLANPIWRKTHLDE